MIKTPGSPVGVIALGKHLERTYELFKPVLVTICVTASKFLGEMDMHSVRAYGKNGVAVSANKYGAITVIPGVKISQEQIVKWNENNWCRGFGQHSGLYTTYGTTDIFERLFENAPAYIAEFEPVDAFRRIAKIKNQVDELRERRDALQASQTVLDEQIVMLTVEHGNLRREIVSKLNL